MSNYQCFKIKRGTEFYDEIKKHFKLLPKWQEVFNLVSNLLNENITKLVYSTTTLIIDPNELTHEENKKLFKNNGEIKNNIKIAKEINEDYKKIIADVGLKEYQGLRDINFVYGVMKYAGQKLESYRTSEDDIYYKADFDLEKKTGGLVEPISEIEYEEKYLEELKKRSK